jgi:hypothetical protein
VIRRNQNIIRWLWAIVSLLVVALGVLANYSNVSTALTADDLRAFAELGFSKPTSRLTYEQEIALFKKVQSAVFKRAPLSLDGIPDYQNREPLDLLRFRRGLCFDRSRTFDKAFTYLGFESRHVYLLFKQGKSFPAALFHYRHGSHAVTEVRTSKGWMLVDSNSEWLAVNRRGEPVDADGVWRRYAEFENAPNYLEEPWWAIRGMYSRKGQLYGAGIAIPELNWHDFLGWLVQGTA